MKKIFLTFFLLFAFSQLFAGGIKGTVKTAKGEPLAFASVAVKNSHIGTMANANGQFELSLGAGQYVVVFQYLGFKAITKNIDIKDGFETLNIVMEEEVLSLNEVKISSKTEDPALSVMRRAIAKSRFHALQVANYSARAYMKGSFTVVSIPKMMLLFDKKAAEEARVGKPNVMESVSEISFKSPNTYKQKVISMRNNMNEASATPMQFLMTSFYQPTVLDDIVSPLSPRAFAYYKFQYEGSFMENGREINKIKVIPRAFGEGVFRGQIYIVENSWAIHSLDLESKVEMFSFRVKQLYGSINDVLMPVNQQFEGGGGMMGLNIKGQFVTSVTYNSLAVNPLFKEAPVVVDEKFVKPDNAFKKSNLRNEKLENLAAQQKELSTKQLRQLIRDYEKRDYQQRKDKKEDVSIVRNDSMTVDSLAKKRSNEFWNEIRAVPLTTDEVKSYKELDSLVAKKSNNINADGNSISIGLGGNKKTPADTTKKKKPNAVTLAKILGKGNYKLSKNGLRLTTQGPIASDNFNYNTVEGIWLEGMMRLSKNYFDKPDSSNKNKIIPIDKIQSFGVEVRGRYEFGLKRFIPRAAINYSQNKFNTSLAAGRLVSQINNNAPIDPHLNALTTIVFEQNLMKVYDKKFVRWNLNVLPFHKNFKISTNIEYAQRSTLENTDVKRIYNWPNRVFTPNNPANEALPNTIFPTHDALRWQTTVIWKPGKSLYAIRNGIKRDISERNFSLNLNYTKGLPIGKSAVNYDFVELTATQKVSTGIKSELEYSLTTGAFLNKNSLYFVDYKHFMGNEFFFQTGNALTTFRNLPYYKHSTANRFVEAHVLNSSRQFLITRLESVRMLGLKENIMLHYLHTPNTPHYAEIGYALDGIIPVAFPFFRVEAVGVFQNFKYQTTVFRIGTTWKFGAK